MKRYHLVALFLLVASLAVAAAGCGGNDNESAATTGGSTEAGGGQAASCSGKIAVMGPFTGDAASIGQEQLNFTKFAVEQFNKENGSNYTLVEMDTQLDPAQASTAAQKVVADSSILGVVGPAGSQEVEAVGPVFSREKIAFISPSATQHRPDHERQVPDLLPRRAERRRAGTDRRGVRDEHARRKEHLGDRRPDVLLDRASPTASRRRPRTRAPRSTASPSARSRRTSRRSSAASRTPTSSSSPGSSGRRRQTFGQQLAEQGSKATILGSDGLFTEDFSIKGSYVSSFAPDVKSVDSSADLVQGYEAEYGKFSSTFGPPAYAATNALLTAINQACPDSGGTPARDSIADAMHNVDISQSILGGPLRFDENGDPEGAKFYLFKVTGKGQYELQS